MQMEIFKQNQTNYTEIFRDLYYHLYANSNSSRAEKIFEDIAKILLVKISLKEVNPQNNGNAIKNFMIGQGSANDVLLPFLVKRVPQLISDSDTFSIGDEAIKKGIELLDKIDLSESPASVLGDAFQSVVGPKLRGDKGQFFTPKVLVKTMVQVANPKPEDKIVDPAAGAGSFLVEAHLLRTQMYPQHKNFGPLIGLEKDEDLCRLGGATVYIATEGVGKIENVNSLSLDEVGKIKSPSPFEADLILTNPPFGAKIGITDSNILSNFDLGHNWGYSKSKDYWEKIQEIRRTQDPQILFLELCFKLLKPGGLVGIILPEGIFGNKNTGYVLDFIRQQGLIETMIDCPRHMFQPSTETKTNVLFIRKFSQKRSVTIPKTLVAVAKTCGHDRRGKTITSEGKDVSNDLKLIGETHASRDSKWWSECELTEPYYIVPRFYHNGAKNAVEHLAKEWKGDVITIDELIKSKFIHMRKGHEVGADAYGTGNIPFIRTSDINNWEVSIDPTKGVSEQVYEKYNRLQKLKVNDILLIVDGRYRIGQTAIIQSDNCKSIIQSHFRIITVTSKSPITAYEFLYILNLPSVLEEMRNLVFIQSTLGSIGKRLGMLQVPLPKTSSEWSQRVKVFRDAIENRALLLSKLKEFQVPEVEC